MSAITRRDFRASAFPLLENHFDEVLDRFYKTFFENLEDIKVNDSNYPKIDAVLTASSFIVNFSVPGVAKECLQVEVNPDRTVRVSGEMSKEYKYDNGVAYASELHKSRFSRLIRLPKEVKENQPKAKLKDGILSLSWDIRPKVEESPPKLVKIE